MRAILRLYLKAEFIGYAGHDALADDLIHKRQLIIKCAHNQMKPFSPETSGTAW